jgi:hypothetical protein
MRYPVVHSICEETGGPRSDSGDAHRVEEFVESNAK